MIVFGVFGTLAAAGLSCLLLLSRDAGAWPVGVRPGSLPHRLERLDDELARTASAKPALSRIEAALAACEEEYTLASRLLPDEAGLDGLRDRLNGLAEAAGADMAEFAAADAPARREDGFEAWRVRVRALGDFDQLAAFVNAAENLDGDGAAPRRVECVDIAVAADAGGDGRHECRAVFEVYRYSDDIDVPVKETAADLAELIAVRRYRYVAGGRDPMRMRPGGAEAAAAPSPAGADEHPVNGSAPVQPERERQLEVCEDDFAGLRVDGVSMANGASRAIVNGRIHRVGDAVFGREGVRVEAIGRDGVVFRSGGGSRRVPVRMYARQ